MIAYFAVGAGSVAVRLLEGRAALVSFASIGSFVSLNHLDSLRAKCSKMFLDSGAFSAWTKGTPIDIARYIAFVHERGSMFDVIASLDEIPAIGQCAPAADRSLANWRAMRDSLHQYADRIIPVHHEGDPVDVLDAYVDAGARLIGLGRTLGRRSKPLSLDFYDQVFNRHPLHAFHAFGNGDPQTLEPYPFESFDCSSWERDAGYSNKHGFPWCRVAKETRMRAYVEALSTIEHRPPKQAPLQFGRPRAVVSEAS